MTASKSKPMTGQQYDEALQEIGTTQVGAARWLKIGDRTSRRWAADGPPEAVAKLLRLMIKSGLTVDDVP